MNSSNPTINRGKSIHGSQRYKCKHNEWTDETALAVATKGVGVTEWH